MSNSFTLNIQFSLSPESLDLLRRLIPVGDLPEHTCCSGNDFEARVTDIVIGVIEQLSKHAHPEKTSGPAEEPKPQAPAEPAPAPEPEKSSGEEITDAQLREAVKEAKDRAGGTAVRTLFSEFEIPNSSACPQERRSELLGRLANL